MVDNQFFYVFLYVLGVLFLLEVGVVWWFIRLYKRITHFFRPTTDDLSGLVSELLKKTRKLEGDLSDLQNDHTLTAGISRMSLNKVYVKRFNPFNEVGGDQSFVLAALDSHNTGFILSSLYMREGNRVYVKPREQGKTTYQLSTEEREALEHCLNQK